MVARRQDAGEERFVSALDCVLLVKLDGGSNANPESRRFAELQAGHFQVKKFYSFAVSV
jgi:hypothetical protein